MSFKRISLNLSHYFQDHRQLSRICIKDNIRNISELKKYICDVFAIKNSFYLKCNNFYLPFTENIEILDDNDLVYVMPTNLLENKVEFDENKSKEETNYEEEQVLKKKKCKEKLNEFENVVICEKKKKKKEKSKKKQKITPENSLEIEKIINNTSYINKEFEIELCHNSDNTQNSSKTNLQVDETIINDEIFNNSDVRPRKKRRCISPMEVENASQNSIQGNKIAIHSVEVLNEEQQQKIIETITKNPEREIFSLDEVINFENKKISPEKQKENNENGIINGQSKRQIVKTISGIGAFLQNLHENSDSSFQSEKNFITQRRRNRVRHRKKKKIEETPVVESPVFKPPKTIANPKLHIKFDENNENRNESNLQNEEKEESFMCSTPMKINNNEDKENCNETSSNIEILNLTLDDIKVNKCVELSGMPNINDLITFKKLKIGENYNPEISQHILAAVQDITNDQQLRLKILGEFMDKKELKQDGRNEFREPMGRFSCITEEDENLEETNEVVLALNNLIEPKLCKM